MKVYLSGAITNKENYLDDFNRASRFFPNCFNPCTVEANSYEEYMKTDLRELLDCTHIYFVNDIPESSGAQLEKAVAVACGIQEIQKEKRIVTQSFDDFETVEHFEAMQYYINKNGEKVKLALIPEKRIFL